MDIIFPSIPGYLGGDMKLVYERNRHGYWQENNSQVVYHSLESVQADVHQNYSVRRMLVLEEDDENYPTKIKFDVADKPEIARYYCEKCGSSDVEEQCWYKINTGEITEIMEESQKWCCQCEHKTTLKEK